MSFEGSANKQQILRQAIKGNKAALKDIDSTDPQYKTLKNGANQAKLALACHVGLEGRCEQLEKTKFKDNFT